MRILFISPYPPSLIRVRTHHFIRGLTKRGHRVTVACPWARRKEWKALASLRDEGCEVLSASVPPWKSLLNCAGALPQQVPLQAVHSWQPRLIRSIEDALAQNEFDVIHVEHLRAALYGLRAMNYVKQGRAYRGSRPVVVWDSVDCISKLFREARQKSSQRMMRWLVAFERPRTEAFEAMLIRRFDRVIVTTRGDAVSLENLVATTEFGTPCAPQVVCNGVDLEQPSGVASERHPATVVMTGKMSYHANAAAARYLVKEIMPLVWQKRPDVCVEIVGQAPTRDVLALARATPGGREGGAARRIVVTGEVADVRWHLRRATLAVAPIVYGTGVQNKVLEAMATSTPVVATRQATAGLDLRGGRDVLIGDTPGEVAAGVLQLLAHPELRMRLGFAGRRFVEENHSWGQALDQLEAVYTGVGTPTTPAYEPLYGGFAS